MIGVRLHAVDTWFFRDGTPFTAGHAPQENVESRFPPNPPTVAGALRATLARANGWNGVGTWSQSICKTLGDGPDLGKLRFGGPFLLRNEAPLFPMPRHLLGKRVPGGWKPAGFLRPGSPVTCDLGDAVRLPQATASRDEGTEAGTGLWLTRDGMNAVLEGKCPDPGEVVPSERLWSTEPRIGLARDSTTRTASEGMLYSTVHIRPRPSVSIGVGIAGLPADWTPPFDRMNPFGGEGRLAEFREWNADTGLDAHRDRIIDVRKVALVALTPLDIEGGIRIGRVFDELGGARPVCACLDRPQHIGGWDSHGHRPLSLRAVLAPGSTVFCEIPDVRRFADAVAANGDAEWVRQGGLARMGRRNEWGFGLVALGAWPVPQDEKQ